MFLSCILLLTSVSKGAFSAFGKEPDDAAIGRIVKALQASGNHQALQDYLSLLSTGEEKKTSQPSITDDLDFVAALSRTPGNELSLPSESSAITDRKPVTKLILQNLDFTNPKLSETEVLSFLQANKFYTLGVLELKGVKGVKNFIETLFDTTTRFPSLFRIIAESSDISLEDIENIYTHFARYPYFIRDMEKISARYDVCAAFCSVEIGKLKQPFFTSPAGLPWVLGKKTNTEYALYYRNRTEDPKTGPFILTVS
ncbi:MAG: hypothetical protein A2621_01565 [Alphaproteobacteria bacterium RIFCSPHIGHO2_01_FULL_41_14]|nr:MAG: hypothetical protein A2065_02725 [Alphaproteobacteria bacterium GWB1_45_5]OFW89586.1 MAG: hypothetical protein A2621_01565 [Alphaproteobacteria bacterium RIFCSPHIGHO2_01_FULL_41_14]